MPCALGAAYIMPPPPQLGGGGGGQKLKRSKTEWIQNFENCLFIHFDFFYTVLS